MTPDTPSEVPEWRLALGAGWVGVRFVDLEPEDGGDLLGRFDSFPRPVIRVSKELTGHARWTTVLHEALHAIEDAYGLDLTESQIRALEIGLCQMWLALTTHRAAALATS